MPFQLSPHALHLAFIAMLAVLAAPVPALVHGALKAHGKYFDHPGCKS